MANNIKTVNGIAAANIKAVNGIAAASVKNYMGEALELSVDIAIAVSYRAVEASGSAITDGGGSETVCAYDPDNNFVLVACRDSDGGGKVVAGAYNSTNGDIDFGAEQHFETSNATSGLSIDYDTSNNRVWLAWIGGGDNTLYARCGTVASDKTISYGTRLTIEDGYDTHSKYNQGLLGQGLAVDQSDGKCLVVWNDPTDSISGASDTNSSHHPTGVILTKNAEDNDITKSSSIRMFNGTSGHTYPMIKCHYDPDNEEWVAISDPANDIRACRIYNNSGAPASDDESTFGTSGHSLQGPNHGATVGVAGRYGGSTFTYDTNENTFHLGTSRASGSTAPLIISFTNDGSSAIAFTSNNHSVSTGTTLSSSKAGGIAFCAARNRIFQWGVNGTTNINAEILTYDSSGGYTSQNSGSLMVITTDTNGFKKGNAIHVDTSSFLSGSLMITGTEDDSADPYYFIAECGS